MDSGSLVFRAAHNGLLFLVDEFAPTETTTVIESSIQSEANLASTSPKTRKRKPEDDPLFQVIESRFCSKSIGCSTSI
jgi:hypothetical protein